MWHAPKLAYFFFLSLIPLLICLILTLGVFLESRSDARELIESYLTSFAPKSASELIGRTLRDVIEGSSPTRLSVAIIFTLWSASRGMTALIEGMNSTYQTEEKRPWWKKNIVSLGLTLSILFLVTSLIIISLYTSPLAEAVFEPMGISAGSIATVMKWLEWPALLFLASITLGVIYKFGPSEKQPGVLGAIIPGLALWILVSMLFRLYLGYFDRFSVTYGLLSSVMILMVWLYLTGLSVLIGASFHVAWLKGNRKS